MSLACPNTEHPDFKYAVEKLGSKDKALYLYDLLGRELPTAEQTDAAAKGEPLKFTSEKQAFIFRINSRIENGKYREKTGKLVPITPSYNAEVFWVEKQEGLADVGKEPNYAARTVTLFNDKTSQARVRELNIKYKDTEFQFSIERVIQAPPGARKASRAPKIGKVYRIKVTQVEKPITIETVREQAIVTPNDFVDNKTREEDDKERDKKLAEALKGVESKVKILSNKEKLRNKSIDALLYKKKISIRAGKSYEVGEQEKLIDQLLAEKDVEKQLANIVEYVYRSSRRIWDEYQLYKSRGETIPIKVLHSWKDSASAFDALLNDKDGLNNILVKEYGFEGGPAYRDHLRKAMDLAASIKQLYEDEGINQLVDWLTPYYHGVYAEKREAKGKEYRRKRFLGQISKDITEKEYVNNYLNENEESLEQETKDLLRKELSKASRDIGVLTRWIDNLLDTKDPVTAAMVKGLVYADEEARLESLERRDEVVSQLRKLEAWYKKSGNVPKSMEEFYGFMLEKIDGKLTGNYVTEAYGSMMEEYRKRVDSSRSFDTSEKRKEYINEWKDANMPLDNDKFWEAHWEFVDQEHDAKRISDKDYNVLQDNRQYRNKLTIGEMTDKGIIELKTGDILGNWFAEHTWDFRVPIDKWSNPQWTKLEKILEDPTDARGDFYRFILKMRRDADSVLPFGFRLDTRLPGVIKQDYERMTSGQGIGATIRGSLSRNFTFKLDDTSRTHEQLLGPDGKPKYFLPTHFTGRIMKDVEKVNSTGQKYTVREFDPTEQSFDIAGIYYKYWQMANDYNHKAKVLPEMELAKFLINNREYIKRNPFGKKILRKGAIPGDEETVPVDNPQLVEQVNDWFLSIMYGEEEATEGKILGLDLAKLLNVINSYTSLNLLGLNVVAGSANVILGETLQHIESFAMEYMTPKDFLYADKFYLKSMKGFIGDIGARDTHGLGTHLVEQFGVFDDYGEADMTRRTVATQLFKKDTLYATSHLGEHYMQSRFLFGLLSNKRAYNSKGEDIGRMLDMYELKNNKLIIKPEVDLVKSNWEEKDQMEFKIKTRGILSRLHGEYSALGKVAIERYALGRMAYLFRHFVVPGFRRRWGGPMWITEINEKGEKVKKLNPAAYSERLGQYVEGNYITSGKFIGALGGKIFGKTEENREEAFFARLIDNLQSFKLSMFGEEWAMLSEHEKANVYRTVYEVGFLILAIILANILAGIKPDPDDEEEWKMRYWAFAAYQAFRLQNELLFFSPKLDSSMSILRSPAASMSFVENLIKLSGQVFHPSEVYESGPWKGRPKIIRTLNEMAPITRQVYRLRDIDTQIPWMQKSGLGGKTKKEETESPPVTP